VSTERTIAVLHFEMPVEVESFEQGVAFVTHFLIVTLAVISKALHQYNGLPKAGVIAICCRGKNYPPNRKASTETEFFRMSQKTGRSPESW
jgi:hypothetical protein